MDIWKFFDEISRDKILQSLGLDPKKPVILFAPTYKPTCIYDLKDAIFEATTEYNLIIKLHHYSWLGKYASDRQHKIFEQHTDKMELPLQRFVLESVKQV